VTLPTAILLDLDDTILDDSSNVEDCWQIAYRSCETTDLNEDEVLSVLHRVRDWYWSDPDRHRIGRLDLTAARRRIVRLAFEELSIANHELADRIGDAYCAERDARMSALPGAIDTVRRLRSAGCRLALVTNGGSTGQRAKIARFELAGLFDDIFVEGELGFGKPDPRVFRHALSRLGLAAAEVCMVGDNLQWDVAAPQTLGIFSVWIDWRRRGLPPSSNVQPDLIVHTLAELPAAAGWVLAR
jgi:putative hydrolase of the HAD superfamily